MDEQGAARVGLADEARLLAGDGFWHTHGIPEAGIESVLMTDGPHGLRKQMGDADHLGLNGSVPATAFPTAAAMACSFDPGLAHEVGRALGEECRREGVGVVLGPGANIKRHPLCGRNFEYFSEDPLLSGKMAAAMIRGIQSQGVGACLKHFALNNQETARMVSDSVVDARAANEVYLRPFEIAVREGRPWAVMAAYNKVNGVHATESKALLSDKLRRSWGFDGAVVSDWGGQNKVAASIAAGLDLVMPGPRSDYVSKALIDVGSGKLDRQALDDAARNVAVLAKRCEAGRRIPSSCDMAEHLQVARVAARESAVLLENDGTLPLRRGARVAVIGAFAREPRYQGAGSSKINPVALDCALDALGEDGWDVAFEPGYDRATGETSAQRLAAAARLAAARDAAVVFVGLPESFESEGFDRADMDLPAGHVALVERVCQANPRTVVVLSCGAPVRLSWRCRPAAVLAAYLGGCQSGHAVADLLSGDFSPSGKLAETWPESPVETALGNDYPEQGLEAHYRESVFVGYRYFRSAGVKVAYPFGYGLSYTSFSYRDLLIEPEGDAFRVSFRVRNDGSRAGAEAAQVYVHACEPAYFAPDEQLEGFEKVWLAPGQEKRVSVRLGSRAFSHWELCGGSWRADEGSYEVRVGASSEDIRLVGRVDLEGETAPFAVSEPHPAPSEVRAALACYYRPGGAPFSEEAFRLIYGRPVPDPPAKRPITADSPLGDLKGTVRGEIVLAIVHAVAARNIDADDEDTRAMTRAMLDAMPVRGFLMAGVPYNLVDAVVFLLNGHWLRTVRSILGR